MRNAILVEGIEVVAVNEWVRISTFTGNELITSFVYSPFIDLDYMVCIDLTNAKFILY